MSLDTHLNPQILFENVDQNSPVLIAVSGGSDSIALLLLASLWADMNGVDLRAITIDHGLRSEAAAEASFVSALCAQRNIPHTTLAWDGIKPQTGVSQAARIARYQLIEQFAFEVGAKSVLVGHQANDQAETMIMRSERNSHAGQSRGLSGIPSVSVLPRGTYLHRPLLRATRAHLRSYLKEHDQVWIEDPSNHDHAYERVRVRAKIDHNLELLENCSRFANVMGRLRKHIVERAVEVLEANLDVSDGPIYQLPLAALQNIEPQIRNFILSVCVTMAGGAQYFSNVSSLLPLLDEDRDTKKTMGGAVVQKQKDVLFFFRENRNIQSCVVKAGEVTLWDNRFLVENTQSTDCFCCAVANIEHDELLQSSLFGLKLKPAAALETSLCLQTKDGSLNLPFVDGFSQSEDIAVTPVYRAIEHFCSEYDFALLDFIERFKHEEALENSS